MKTTTPEFDDIHLLIGAYALDAVDDIERARFERHLSDCADCERELGELRQTAALIGAADVTDAPTSMRSAVFDRIAQTPQALPSDSSERSPERIRKSSLAVRLLGAAAAVLAIGTVGFGAVAYQQSQRVDTITAEASLVNRVLSAPDAVTKQMPLTGGATTTIVYSQSQGQAVMVATNVPALPDGQTYENWTLTAGGDARPAGTWVPQANGSAAVPIQGDLASAAAVATTVEPAGGSAQPTTKPIGSVLIA